MDVVNLLRPLAIIAFDGAISESFEPYYRHMCRWYSREFHTPLPDVEKMDEVYVITTYLEDLYYKYAHSESEEDKMKLENIRQQLLKSPEELAQQEEDDDAWIEEMTKKVNDDKNKQQAEKNPNLTNDTPDEIFVQGEDSIPKFED